MESFDGARGEAALLAAVITRAVEDGCANQINHAHSAMHFLFDRNVGGLIGYAAALGFDAEAFRQKLLKMMRDDRSDLSCRKPNGKLTKKPAPGNEWLIEHRRRFMANLRQYVEQKPAQ